MDLKYKIRPKYIILISVSIALIMVISAYMEISESRKTMYNLLMNQANSIVKTINLASKNTFITNNVVEDLIIEKLFTIGNNLVYLDSINLISKKVYSKIINDNNLSSIIKIDKSGKVIFCSDPHILKKDCDSISASLLPLLNNKERNIMLGFPIKDLQNHFLVMVKCSSTKGGAFLLGIHADYFLEFRKRIGIGRLIQNLAEEKEIVYIALQDEQGIISASSNIEELSSLENDTFLFPATKYDTILTRNSFFKNYEILEIIKPLFINSEFYGIFRIGISLDTIRELDARMLRRVLIISLVLIVIGIIVFSIILINQHYTSLQQEYWKIQSYTDIILENMADGVIAVDKERNILFVNKAIEKIFMINLMNINNKKIGDFLNDKEINEAFEKNEPFFYKEMIYSKTENEKSILLVSMSIVKNEINRIEYYIFVIRDITEQKRLAVQVQRNEKMAAIGELAAGVAHEIRNPLNSISIIIQRLKYEFEPKQEKKEYYHSINNIRGEIDRLNKIIEQFLMFSRKPDLKMEYSNIIETITEVIEIVKQEAEEQNIKITTAFKDPEKLYFDKEQIKQTIINLIKNSIESIESSGIIEIAVKRVNKFIMISVSDNGKGIPNDNLTKIFNLYFTTKKNGSGIGLSLVNQIISEHNGKITVESEVGVGTVFKIYLPV